MRRAFVPLTALALALAAHPARALNKQGARGEDEAKPPIVNLSGYVFFGGFVFNPTYAARPDNSGLAALRFGLHVDLDLYRRWLTLSYDENSFTDGTSGAPAVFLPSEHDHIVGLLSQIPLPRKLTLTLAVHYELDSPGFGAPAATANYTQSYVDAYARLAWERDPFLVYVALGGFLWNPTYAARPDNAGLALLRYVVHGEYRARPWLVFRLDFNFFTDRDEWPLLPTEVDILNEVALRWRDFELRFDGEADLPIGSYPLGGPHPPVPTPGLRQLYLAALFQWSFDVNALLHRKKNTAPASRPPSAPF